jgi:hypothetical protein
MTKMVVPLACFSSDKCAAKHRTLLLPLKSVLHKDSSSYSTSWLFERRRRRRGVTVLLHKNSSSYGRERGKGNSHKTRVYDLSELVAPWPMSVSFLCQASSLFIAPNRRRDTYKRELKKRKMKGAQCRQSRNSFPMKASG